MSNEIVIPIELDEGPLPDEQPEMEMVEWEGEMWPVVRRCGIVEEAYVQYELAITLAAGADPARLERSERYLRWRHRGFVTGHLDSL